MNVLDPTSDYRARLRQHYAPLVAQHGGSYRAVDWGSEAGQQKRFRVLLESCDFRRARVLDVGCGVGALVAHLQQAEFAGAYCGIDLVPEMVTAAKRLHPKADFREENLADCARDFAPDLVVASGLFTFADEAELKATVRALFAATRRVVAFNSLSAWAPQTEPGEYYADPTEVLRFCRELTSRVVVRHDYMPHDFTVYLYREDVE